MTSNPRPLFFASVGIDITQAGPKGAIPELGHLRQKSTAEKNHQTKTKFGTENTRLGMLDASALSVYCNYYFQDYACLGYPYPPECGDRAAPARELCKGGA